MQPERMVRVVRFRRERPNPYPAVAKSDDCRKRVAQADLGSERKCSSSATKVRRETQPEHVRAA